MEILRKCFRFPLAAAGSAPPGFSAINSEGESMRWNRRDVFKLVTGAAALAALPKPFAAHAAPEVAPHPDPSKFASGDILWPAKPNVIIPYSRSTARDGGNGVAEADEWARGRDEYLRQTPVPSDPAGKAARDRLTVMTYEEFRALYLLGSEMQVTRNLSIPQISVGHVALLEIGADGVPWVIEAMPKGSKDYQIVTGRFPDGIIRNPYSKWIGEHGGYNVWHGRVKTEGDRGAIAAAAKTFLGRDYWFWSLDLGDETSFYCSKLVWLSIFKGLGIAIDGDKTTARQLWLSPKKLMKLDTIALLHNPGPYGG
jgi:hypothetical protein